MKNIILLSCMTLLFIGCGKYDLENRINLANTISKQNNFKLQDIQTDYFKLRSYQKLDGKSLVLKIYIEGDGFAWVDRYTLSSNPTPINPVALKLAMKDKSQNIAYIARPCQYVKNVNCSEIYWADKRFAEEVINSINQAITQIKQQSKATHIELIGFSGGGAIVTLIASIRDDIKHITTIAGNLNHTLLHQHHNIPNMINSLNPIDISSKISTIPQIHYVGEDDKIIPLKMAKSFKKASNNSKNIKIIIIPNATHTKGWDNLRL